MINNMRRLGVCHKNQVYSYNVKLKLGGGVSNISSIFLCSFCNIVSLKNKGQDCCGGLKVSCWHVLFIFLWTCQVFSIPVKFYFVLNSGNIYFQYSVHILTDLKSISCTVTFCFVSTQKIYCTFVFLFIFNCYNFIKKNPL